MCIPIFEYNIEKGLIQIGQVGANSPIFNCLREEPIKSFFAYMVIDNFEEEPTSIVLEYFPKLINYRTNIEYFSYNYSDINQIEFKGVFGTINLVQISNAEDKLINFDFKDFNGQFQLFEFDSDPEYIESIETLKNFTNYKYVSKDFYSKKKYQYFYYKFQKNRLLFSMVF